MLSPKGGVLALANIVTLIPFHSNSLSFIVVAVESITCPLYDSAFNLMVKYDPIRLHSCFIRFPFYFMKEKFFQQFLKPFYMFL